MGKEIFKEILMSELENDGEDITNHLTKDSTMADILMLFLWKVVFCTTFMILTNLWK